MSTFRNLLSKTSSVPGFVGGWKSYGRSNSEDASTRDILLDYSGNGRDIKLYNFAFSGMSGYGGYERNWDEWIDVYIGNNGHNYKENNVLHILEISSWANTITDVVSGETVKLKLRVSGLSEGITNNEVQNIQLYFNASTAGSTFYIREDGDYDVNLTAPEGATQFYILAKSTETLTGWTPLTTPITIEQLPTYPGGLVSDGVDDYGQCIKGFTLPDDYTVVAIRRIITGNNGGVASKGSIGGAFLFDAGENDVPCWSYGKDTSVDSRFRPALFSYQTKLSYNGQAIGIGDETDSSDDIFFIFRQNISHPDCESAVLYDLRIYDHTLTAEELQIVKDEMMSDYEAATGGGIADITYVADWDGKDRSNDEDEPMRSTWTDRATGKVIDLHNFAFAGMSGWNGYSEDFNQRLAPILSDATDHILLCTVTSVNNVWIWRRTSELTSAYNTIASMRIKIIGISAISATLRYYYIPDENPATRDFININSDGIYTLPPSVKHTGENIGLYLLNLTEASIGKTVKVEQLPLYPGALVGDGIDNYGVTQEAINEEVGTIICHYKNFKENPPGTSSGRFSYIYEIVNGQPDPNDDRMYMALTGINIMRMGEGGTYNYNEPISYHSKIPKNYNNRISLFSRADTIAELGYAAIYRLILIKEQLNNQQIEYLRWKVEKEYRDWCKANGYEYAINQLTA